MAAPAAREFPRFRDREHLVEHLQLEEFLALLDAVASRLRPGGLCIAETPNPTSLFVLGNSYVLDPTHVRPVHPQLLAFLCERAGLREIALEFYAPSDSERVQSIDTSEASGAPDWGAKQTRRSAGSTTRSSGARLRGGRPNRPRATGLETGRADLRWSYGWMSPGPGTARTVPSGSTSAR